MKRESHKIKSWTLFFSDILSGERTSDIRCTEDRRFLKGDYMELQEWDPIKNKYTGRWALVEITYVQTNKSNPCAISREALRDDYTVLSIKLIGAGTYKEYETAELNGDPVPLDSYSDPDIEDSNAIGRNLIDSEN